MINFSHFQLGLNSFAFLFHSFAKSIS